MILIYFLYVSTSRKRMNSISEICSKRSKGDHSLSNKNNNDNKRRIPLFRKNRRDIYFAAAISPLDERNRKIQSSKRIPN